MESLTVNSAAQSSGWAKGCRKEEVSCLTRTCNSLCYWVSRSLFHSSTSLIKEEGQKALYIHRMLLPSRMPSTKHQQHEDGMICFPYPKVRETHSATQWKLDRIGLPW